MIPKNLPRHVELVLGLDDPDDADALRAAASTKLGLAPDALGPLRLQKRSLDCRKGRIRFHLLLEVGATEQRNLGSPEPKEVSDRHVVIIGDGPAGMFCAYQLARFGIGSTVVDRGKPVQPRRRDLKGLNQRGTVDPNSNYCFGEGGAGTYSDGKLYTRSHKRGDVRDVLEILAAHGAPQEILTEARPHIGSNRLPEVVLALRQRLEDCGVRFLFQSRVVDLTRSVDGTRVRGVRMDTAQGSSELEAEAVVLATGHSARDVFTMLHEGGLELRPKPFALGVRIEHPQPLINRIQYGKSAGHPRLPSAAYRLADSRAERAVFSFCMCPGGFIVPASTSPGELVVNGMSLSKRDSPFANSGLVAAIEPSDVKRAGFDGPLGGLGLQSMLERRAFEAGGSSLSAPATRVTDFLARRASSTVPHSSYIPGLVASDVGTLLDAPGLDLATELRRSLGHLGKRLPGFLSEDAVVVGVETRTSAPVWIPRTRTLVSPQWDGLYPCGEGAGYAGGIVSAAVDGMRVARAIADRFGARPIDTMG